MVETGEGGGRRGGRGGELRCPALSACGVRGKVRDWERAQERAEGGGDCNVENCVLY